LSPRRIVLIGASGVFGARLAAMIARWPDVVLVLSARRLEPLEVLRDQLGHNGAAAAIEVAALDRENPRGLDALAPFAVVDAAGPFQGDDFRLPRAVLAIGAHYVDLADARDFVDRFPAALADAAETSGRWAITGASSTPALSTAALDQLTRGWSRIDAVTTAISPGADAPRGPSVIAAIFSWVGRPVRVFERGAWTVRPGWSGSRRVLFPGLGPRWVALADTADLDVLPRRYTPRFVGRFEAGLELPFAHHGLALLGWARRVGLISDLRSLAGPLGVMADRLAHFGSDRGGMVVEAVGKDENHDVIRARWGLWAEAGAGPNTPAAPAAAILRALLDDRLIGPPRAAVCVGLLPLDDLLAPLEALPIRTRVDLAWPRATSLFARALGPRVTVLPDVIQQAHDGSARTLAGWARGRGDGGIARLVRLIQGLPERGRHDTRVTIAPENLGETWTRQFGSRRFRSRIQRVREDAYAFEETVGPITFRFHAADYPGGFSWMFESWRLGPIALPAAWAPRTRARTFARDGVYRFRVLVAHPWIGVIFGYAGRLSLQPS
jgi:hypothetical protein